MIAAARPKQPPPTQWWHARNEQGIPRVAEEGRSLSDGEERPYASMHLQQLSVNGYLKANYKPEGRSEDAGSDQSEHCLIGIDATAVIRLSKTVGLIVKARTLPCGTSFSSNA